MVSSSSLAQSGPAVYDRANLLTEAAENSLNQQLIQLERETSAEVAVLTVDDTGGASIEDFAQQTFNEWGIGKREFNNGVLIIVAVLTRKTRIHVGYGLEDLLTDSLCGEILDEKAIPFFKQGNYQEGITQTTLRVIGTLRNNPEMAKGVSSSTPWYLLSARKKFQHLSFGFAIVAGAFFLYAILFGRKSYSPVVFIFFILLLVSLFLGGKYYYTLVPGKLDSVTHIIAGILGFFATLLNLSRYKRNAPKKCKHCSSPMVRLAEDLDDQHLNKSQLAEEKFKSVDYDVWHCSACLHNEVKGYKTFFTRAQKCPQCQALTGKHKKTTILVHATRSNSGKSLEEFVCQDCKFNFTKEQIIPRISSSSSSSSGSSGGGSFGGGSSGGGGASRGW